MGKITGIIKSAEEITGQKDCTSFEGRGYNYSKELNVLAGNRIELQELFDTRYYYYRTKANLVLKKDWVKDIKEEVDWSTVKMDAKVIIDKGKFHFAGVSMNPIIIKIWCFGKTSWTINHSDNWFEGNISDVTLAEAEDE